MKIEHLYHAGFLLTSGITKETVEIIIRVLTQAFSYTEWKTLDRVLHLIASVIRHRLTFAFHIC